LADVSISFPVADISIVPAHNLPKFGQGLRQMAVLPTILPLYYEIFSVESVKSNIRCMACTNIIELGFKNMRFTLRGLAEKQRSHFVTKK
jgi:hypothetical protein